MTGGGGGGGRASAPEEGAAQRPGPPPSWSGGRGWLLTDVPSAFTSKIVAEKFHAVLALLPVLKGKVV